MHRHAPVFHAIGLGISFAQLLQWIEQYGLPLVLQVLPLILNGGITDLTVQQIIIWVETALSALSVNQPLPPLPTPSKS